MGSSTGARGGGEPPPHAMDLHLGTISMANMDSWTMKCWNIMTFLSPEGTIMIALIIEELVWKNISTYAHYLLSSSISKKIYYTSFFFSNTLRKVKRYYFFYLIIPLYLILAKTPFSIAFYLFLGYQKYYIN